LFQINWGNIWYEQKFITPLFLPGVASLKPDRTPDYLLATTIRKSGNKTQISRIDWFV
jgi:hypothetical protein